MKKIRIGLLSILTLILLGACGSNENASSEKNDKDKLSIITTFYPMYDFTKNIVGDEGDVKLLIPAGSEPHDYEPSAKNMADIHDADVFVYHNENMETWVPKAKKGWEKGDLNIVEGTEGMVLLPGSEEGHDHSHEGKEHHHELDPHTWVSPKMALKEVESIKEQLVKLYPERAEIFEANAEKYETKLTKLDDDYSASLSNAKQRSFVTQHAAFGYLALDYDLNQVAIAGLTPEQEPSASRLAELKTYVADNDIKYIYFEANTNDKIAKTLADEAKVQMEVLDPLESLSKKQMDAGEDYVSVMEKNLKALEKTTTITGKDVQPENEEEAKETIATGYFQDSDVKDRELSEFEGEWQSAYPLLKDGSLDQVFDYKAKMNKDKTADAYKDYYDKGFKTDIDSVTITSNTIDFIVGSEHHEYTYKAAGHKILDYGKGKRGVRFLFETDDADAGQFKYIQFSDHNIAPAKPAHFHAYFGEESQDKLLEQKDNWPTFYPDKLSAQEIAQELVAH